MSRSPVLLICMGVSGSGKTTVAQYLANEFGLKYFEADDFHNEDNRALMSAGTALSDAQREPWINSICAALSVERLLGCDCVLAYSGLRRAHRQRFRELGFNTSFLYLQGEESIISQRMETRKGHFMPAAMLESQLRDMQSTINEDDVVCLDTGNSQDSTLATVKNHVSSILLDPEKGQIYA